VRDERAKQVGGRVGCQLFYDAFFDTQRSEEIGLLEIAGLVEHPERVWL
jgi:hypothetical protein